MKKSPSTTWRRRHERGFALALALAVAPAAQAQSTPKVYGLELVPWSKKLEPARYRSSRDWDKTLKYFKDKFRGWRGIRWHREVNLPTVKYVHIQNLNPRARWSGVNVYQRDGGEVRIYVLERPRGVDGESAAKQGAEPVDTGAPAQAAGSAANPQPN